MRVLILANGEPPSQILLARLAAEHDLFIAVDGAVRTGSVLGQMPGIVSGDFDSVSMEEARQLFPQAECIVTPDQNFTDLEKAFQIALNRGGTSVTIAGAAGRRIDHTLGNFSLLLRWRLDLPGMPVMIVADGSEVRALTGEMTLETEIGDAVSLLSFDGLARVSIEGVRWPLTDHRLAIGVGGLLNEAVADRVTLKAEGGVVLVCHLSAALRRHG
ncbi:MAG: thiamine diphosphokinase [Janthinobacterium lividum]